jgi:hypothetical protein
MTWLDDCAQTGSILVTIMDGHFSADIVELE